MRGNSHVRFGERAEETDQPKGRHRASVRLDHTHATIALCAGVPVKVISERLGHATPAFTLQQYAHVIPGMQAEAAQQVADLVDPPGPDSSEASDDGEGSPTWAPAADTVTEIPVRDNASRDPRRAPGHGRTIDGDNG
jgi:hypothetical protein